jgi:hypothetical protein
MIYNAVQTRKKAIELLQKWFLDAHQNNSSANEIIDNCTMRCECGETTGLIAWIEGDEKGRFAKVAYCASCGDDNAIESEVLYIEN